MGKASGMPLRLYVYDKCDSCRKALTFLRERSIPFETLPVREQPPTEQELRAMLQRVGSLRRLFNTSGQDYRALRLGEKLGSMTEEAALALLASNGNLVKRPFVIGRDWGTTGFREDEWRQKFP
jgi:arsenate reductase (glutaredoxin)